jgi:putative ABC transport system permease protein
MNLWQLVCKEIMFRKISFLLGVVCVAAAIAALVGSVVLLQAHDMRTELLLIERERSTRREMQKMEDDYRKIMRDLGYNVMIIPIDQSLTALQARGYPDTTMPYDYVERLARGNIQTLNHLLPVLQKRIVWPEYDIDVILSGTPGQVPIVHLMRFLTEDGMAYRNPITKAIQTGELILGHSVAADLGLSAGDRVALMGREFMIRQINPAEGTTDDIAVWCDYGAAQEMLDMKDRINLILALECVCKSESLGVITREVQRILPDVAVIEFSSRVKARAQARSRAEQAHLIAVDAERDHRHRMYNERRLFASILVPFLLTGSAIWIFFLILANVRERRGEIGILRAIGVQKSAITSIFLLKAIIIGIIGALAGSLAGLTVGATWGGVTFFSNDFAGLIRVPMLIAAILTAPALCALAGWLPARCAARQDPAVVLRDE